MGVSTDLFVHLLQRSMKERDPQAGREAHLLMVSCGLENDTYLGGYLIRMFAFFERLSEAKQVFCKLSQPNVFSWSAIISAHAKSGQNDQAIKLYYRMRNLMLELDGHVFVEVLKACSILAALDEGKGIHGDIVESGFESDLYVISSLIDMYSKCGCLEDARAVFDRLPEQNVVTWSALIRGYAQHFRGQEALQIFQQMQEEGMDPDAITFICILKACSSAAALEQSQQIHACIIEHGFESDLWIGNALVDMYSKRGDLKEARMVFDRLPERDVVTCSALIEGYVLYDHSEKAIQVFQEMQQDCIQPDFVIFICILKACSSVATLDVGQQIHANIIQSGFESDVFVGSTLIDMYAKCGSLTGANIMFHRLPNRNVVTWNALVSGYSQQECSKEALQLFDQMQQDGMNPDPVTFGCILKVCSSSLFLEKGRYIHGQLVENGLELDRCVGNALMDMYAKCESFEDARILFDRLPQRDIVTWTALVGGYTHHDHGQEALQLIEQMQQESTEPDAVMFACILTACSSVASLDQGRCIHSQIIREGWEVDLFLGNTLIDMYAKCGSLQDAFVVFDKLQNKSVVAWNSLISGYADHDNGQVAIKLFKRMQEHGMEPNLVTFICILKACSSIAALKQGRQIHYLIISSGCESDVLVGSTLINMYAKCGSLVDAQMVFDRLSQRNIVTWSAIISGCAQHCDYWLAFRYFEGMEQEGIKPDNVTFLCLLSACSYVGLVEVGRLHFKSMRVNHGIAPSMEHYNCMLDVLGNAGLLDEAEDLVMTMPFQANIVGWTSLLSACRRHTNIGLGRGCFDRIISMDTGNSAAYVLMSNIYANAGMLEDAKRVEELRRNANGWKKPAKAYIEIDDQVHGFMVGDKVHPRSNDIYAKLKTLNIQMREEGYQPRLNSVLDAESDNDRVEALCGHCEKLAIAFGLLCTPQGTTIRVAKNLRMCADCHDAAKAISRIEMREIIVKDTYCIHHFQDGLCSCKYSY